MDFIKKTKKTVQYASLRRRIKALLVLSISGLFIGMAQASSYAPPSDLSMQDKANVDLLLGLPVISQTDLKIGNEDLSLVHTFSSYAGHLSSFYDISKSYVFVNPTLGGYRAVVRVGTLSQDFHKPSSSSPYLPSNGDGATLTGTSSTGFIYTSASGMRYYSKDRKIVYPNGFTITNEGFNVVKTNNGLQFRYDRDVFSDGSSAIRSITAYNMAKMYCSTASSQCNFNSTWPRSTYNWGNSRTAPPEQEYTISVTDPVGVTTRYVHKKIASSNSPSTPPRLLRVYDNESSSPTRVYNYYEYTGCSNAGIYFWSCSASKIIVDNARINNVLYDYFFTQGGSGSNQSTHGRVSSANWSASINSVSYQGQRPSFTNSSWRSGSAVYSGTGQNRITHLTEKGKKFTFDYDLRGNVTNRTQLVTKQVSGVTVSNIIEEAAYPASCHSGNFKYCNKPTWTKDGNGNLTNYYYHSGSGEVAKIVYPAGANGVRPTTFYRYAQKYAKFYQTNGSSLSNASAPIWRLVETESCINSAAQSTSCRSGDGFKTKYEYQHNNLWRTAEIDIAPNGEARRTCFEYDSLGNQIGVTTPNANLTTCS